MPPAPSSQQKAHLMEKNKQSTDGAAIPVKGAMPMPDGKATTPPTASKDAGARKLDVKTDKVSHGAAHTTKK